VHVINAPDILAAGHWRGGSRRCAAAVISLSQGVRNFSLSASVDSINTLLIRHKTQNQRHNILPALISCKALFSRRFFKFWILRCPPRANDTNPQSSGLTIKTNPKFERSPVAELYTHSRHDTKLEETALPRCHSMQRYSSQIPMVFG
jgi:hypothetical protein